MPKLRGIRAFTLIEIMICIAIMAIVMAIQFSARNSYQWMRREGDYRFALRNARYQIDALRSRPYESLPPQVMKVPADGRLDLHQTDLVPGSVAVRGVEPVHVDEVAGQVTLDKHLAGKTVIVDYRFYVPDTGEAHTVPSQAPYDVHLDNAPAVRITSVEMARGDTVSLLSPPHWTLKGDTLHLSSAEAGHVVTVDYQGSKIRNEVAGRFLDDALNDKTDGVGTAKMLTVEESYGDHVMKVKLSLLKVPAR